MRPEKGAHSLCLYKLPLPQCLQKFLIMRNRYIGGIGDPDLIFLGQSPPFHVHIINFNAIFLYFAYSISRNVCYIFILTHIQTMPFYHYRSFRSVRLIADCISRNFQNL